MADFSFYCTQGNCHGNRCGFCMVLTTPVKGKPCPFYKSKLRLRLEREALEIKDMAAYHKAALVDKRAALKEGGADNV